MQSSKACVAKSGVRLSQKIEALRMNFKWCFNVLQTDLVRKQREDTIKDRCFSPWNFLSFFPLSRTRKEIYQKIKAKWPKNWVFIKWKNDLSSIVVYASETIFICHLYILFTFLCPFFFFFLIFFIPLPPTVLVAYIGDESNRKDKPGITIRINLH